MLDEGCGDSVKELAKTFQECRHFRGVQNPCGTGVDLKSVRDDSGGPYRWPCLQLVGLSVCKTECASRSLLTAEELAERDRENDAAVTKALAQLSTGKCHECGAQIEPSQVVGRCKYASCGHRIGQVLDESEEML